MRTTTTLSLELTPRRAAFVRTGPSLDDVPRAGEIRRSSSSAAVAAAVAVAGAAGAGAGAAAANSGSVR